MYQQRYLITGGSGFIGTELVKQLLLENQDVTVLTRDEVRTANHFDKVMKQALSNVQNPNQNYSKVKTLDNLDKLNHDDTFEVIVNLAGQGIADKRWTNKVKGELLSSRLETTKSICEYVENTVVKPDVFISGSALGYYGLRSDDNEIDENGDIDTSFSSRLCQAWEAEAKTIENLGVRTAYLRTGIVLGKDGGALAKMLPPFKMGVGGPMGDGKQWMSWIHMTDIVNIIRYIVENDKMSGAINATAPTPVSNKLFSKTLGKALKRPALIPMPAFMVTLLFGEMGEELLLSGQRVVPSTLLASGFEFTYTELIDALKVTV